MSWQARRTIENGWSTNCFGRIRSFWVYNRHVAFNDFTELPLVAFPDGCAYRRAALAILKRRAKSSFFAYTSASYENIRSAVSAGLGIGILPACATTPDHFILTAKEGFPKLPNVRLTLLYRSRGSLLNQLAEVLRRLVTQNTAR
jgi:DNA-binding transcriptional LysR family regulator